MLNIKRLFIVLFLFFFICQPLLADEQEIADKYKDYKVVEVESSSKNIIILKRILRITFTQVCLKGMIIMSFLTLQEKVTYLIRR